jgi:hypothetical protein
MRKGKERNEFIVSLMFDKKRREGREGGVVCAVGKVLYVSSDHHD